MSRPGVIGSGAANVIRKAAASVVFVAATTSAWAQTDPATLARARKCLNCHALDEKLVGPAFKAVAARYAADRTAEDRLAQKIREGGSGTWGVVPMPSNDVTRDEAKTLAHWVLQQK